MLYSSEGVHMRPNRTDWVACNGFLSALASLLVLASGSGAWACGPFEKADKNLCPAGAFEGDALKVQWKTENNKGGFAVSAASGRKRGTCAKLVSTSAKDRGKLYTSFMVPAGADVRVTVWAKSEKFHGGIWANLEGPGAPKGAKFDIAGGTYDWTEYVFRTTTSTAKAAKGGKVKLAVWFYMYGKGTAYLDDLEVRVIESDAKAEAEWARKRAQAFAGEVTAWVKKPPGLAQARAVSDVAGLDGLIRSCANTVSGSKGWGVLVTNAATRVFRDRPFRRAFANEVKLTMARHEFEGAQLVLFAYDKDLTGVRVAVNGIGDKGLGCQVLPVAYGKRPNGKPIPWYVGHNTQAWPDPLLPNRSFTVKQGTVQPVYLRFYCPKDAEPGQYKGTVSIQTSQGKADVPVSITVAPVALPVRLNLKTMMVAGRKDKPYLDLALEQRMGIGTIYAGMSWTKPRFPAKGNSFDFSKVEKDLQYAIDRGLNAFTLAQTPKSGKWGFPKTYTPAWKKNMTRVIRSYGKWLKDKGWFDLAYYNNIDEPWNTRWPQVKEIYEMAKKADPKVKVFSCVNKVGALEALKNHADTYDVYIQQHGQQQADARLADGKEIWWAVCIWPSEHPNVFIEFPLMDARVIGWMAFKHKISGFEYWDMTSWGGDWKPTGKKPPTDGSWMTCADGVLVTDWIYGRKGRNGDGYLVYPGPDGKPVNSLRFEALRDGIEEHELLTQLKAKLPKLSGADKTRAEALLEGGDGLVTNYHVFSTSAELLCERREEVLALLSK